MHVLDRYITSLVHIFTNLFMIFIYLFYNIQHNAKTFVIKINTPVFRIVDGLMSYSNQMSLTFDDVSV